MKLSELPTRDLMRAIEATESSQDCDAYALAALRAELERRLTEIAAEDSE